MYICCWCFITGAFAIFVSPPPNPHPSYLSCSFTNAVSSLLRHFFLPFFVKYSPPGRTEGCVCSSLASVSKNVGVRVQRAGRRAQGLELRVAGFEFKNHPTALRQKPDCHEPSDTTPPRKTCHMP